MKMGGGAKPFGIDAERVPALARQVIAAGAEWRGLAHLHRQPGARCRSDRRNAGAMCSIWRRSWPTRSARRCRISTWAAASAFPISTATQPLDIAAIGAALAERFAAPARQCLQTPNSASNSAAISSARRGFICTRIVDRKVSHGETYPRHRWRAAPPARRLGQFRHGGAAQLSRSRSPRASTRRAERRGQCRRLPVHPARPAGRPGACCRMPKSAISSRCSAPVPTARAPAPRPSLARARRAKCWFRIAR